MDYKVNVPKKITKEIEKIHPSDVPSIRKAIRSLADNPRPDGCAKLNNPKEKGTYRIRVGSKYRILYDIYDESHMVEVQFVGLRANAY